MSQVDAGAPAELLTQHTVQCPKIANLCHQIVSLIIAIMALLFNISTIRVIRHIGISKSMRTIITALMTVEIAFTLLSLPMPLFEAGLFNRFQEQVPLIIKLRTKFYV